MPADTSIVVENQEITNKDYSGQKLKRFVSIASHFVHCNFKNMDIAQATFGGGERYSTYTDCTFDGSTLSATTIGVARFEHCSFKNIVIDRLIGHTAEFVNCTFSGELNSVLFFGTVPDDLQAIVEKQKLEFVGNDFSGASFNDVSFKAGIDLTQQTMPLDPDFRLLTDAPVKLSKVKVIVQSWSQDQKKDDALKILGRMERPCKDGQKHILLDYNRFSKVSKSVTDKIYELLFDDLHNNI